MSSANTNSRGNIDLHNAREARARLASALAVAYHTAGVIDRFRTDPAMMALAGDADVSRLLDEFAHFTRERAGAIEAAISLAIAG
jgi:hypothetical protein